MPKLRWAKGQLGISAVGFVRTFGRDQQWKQIFGHGWIEAANLLKMSGKYFRKLLEIK